MNSENPVVNGLQGLMSESAAKDTSVTRVHGVDRVDKAPRKSKQKKRFFTDLCG
jgi:hypothetical protein